MARSKSYLTNEAKELNVELTGTESIEGIMDKLMAVKTKGVKLIEEQFEPMAAKDAKVYMNYEQPVPWDTEEMNREIWNNSKWIAETKFDGVRMKAHLSDSQYRFDSRNRSDVSYAYNEVTQNFPHFKELAYDERLEETILDGEFMMPIDTIDTGSVVTQGTLTTTMAVTGSGPDKAIPLQEKYGYCEYHVFDLPKLAGKWITDMKWEDRRVLLEQVVKRLNNPYIKISTVYTDLQSTYNRLSARGITVELVPTLKSLFEDLTNGGGEGLMFKDVNGKYFIGKRPNIMMKLKRFESCEGFITGFVPGENAFTGLVGALKVSAYLPNGEEFEFAAVSQMKLDFRKEITNEDGTLKSEYYGKVIEVLGQERTKTNRFRHAILYRWRTDRSPESCKIEV